MIKRVFGTWVLSLLTVSQLTVAAPAAAQESYGGTSLQVMQGWTREDGSQIAAFVINLPKGWKTYWRSPGDAGIPPTIRWAASGNLADLAPRWPTPQVMDQNGMTSIGYSDHVIVPIILKPRREGIPIRLRGRMDIGVCKDVCMPETLRFDARLQDSLLPPDANNPIKLALHNRPLPADEAGVKSVSCTMTPTEDGLKLSATIQVSSVGGAEFAVVETADPQIWVAEAHTRRNGHTLQIETEMMHMEYSSFAVDRAGVRITLLGANKAVDIQGCPAK